MIRPGSFDLGNGFCKLVTSTKELSFQSVISVEDQTATGFSAAGLSSNHDFVIEFRGKRWAIGDTVASHGLTPVTIRHRSRIETDFYQVLFAASLALGIGNSAEVQPIISLPPAAYWDKDKQKKMLAGTYEVGFGGKTLTYSVPIETIQVVPEGFGTAVLMCLDAKGKVTDSSLFNAKVGVVDIGTLTTDFLMFDKLKLIRKSTDSINHALSDLHEKLRTFVSSQGVDVDVWEADDTLRDGYYLKAGRRVSITTERGNWASDLTQAIAGQIRTVWSGGDEVEYIIVTGDGSPYVAPLLAQEFEHIYEINSTEHGVEPWFSNAEGAYRYSMFLKTIEDQQEA